MTKSTTCCPGNPSHGPAKAGLLRLELRLQLLTLSFHAFEQCILQLLVKMGYTEVTSTGRTHLRGRTHNGGRDLEAYSTCGVTKSRLVLQIKQYTRPVSRRFLDELRGVCQRTGAQQGLLITTSTFARAARIVADARPVTPLRLVDGDELLDLLVTHSLGVKNIGPDEFVIDADFFAGLQVRYPKRFRLSRAEVSPVQSGQWQSSSSNVPGVTFGLPGRKDEMTWRTHVLFSISTLWLLDIVPGAITPTNIAVLSVLAGFGALVPDLDAAESKIKSLTIAGVRPFAPLASAVHLSFGHRSLLHSLAGLLIFGTIALSLAFFWGWEPSLALWLGYASHLALDACTRSGIPFFYPHYRRYYLLPWRRRFVTGSWSEELLIPFLAWAVLLLLLSHLPFS